MAPKFSLSPSRIGRYFYHECDRYLLFHAMPKQQRTLAGIPSPSADHSPVTAAILAGGYAWEREVVEKQLADRVMIAPSGQRTALQDRTFDTVETVTHLKTMAPGQYLYQGTLIAPGSFYQAYGLDAALVQMTPCRPDLIAVTRAPDGRRALCIIDLKASDALKTSHKVQATLYAMLLEHVIEAEAIDTYVDLTRAGIWLYGTQEPEWFDVTVIRPHLEQFLRTEVPRLISTDPQQASWHLHYRCEWCEFYDTCRLESEDRQSVSLLPYMTPQGRQHLRSPGIEVNTLRDMRAFLKRDDAGARLDACASLKGKDDRLRAAVEAMTSGQVRAFGSTSCVMPVHEHIRLLLTLQREPVSGEIYAAALLRLGADDIFRTQARHEQQWVATSVADCRRVRREFLQTVYDILAEVHAYNSDKEWAEQKSVQSTCSIPSNGTTCAPGWWTCLPTRKPCATNRSSSATP